MKTFILAIICSIVITKYGTSQTIASISVDHGNIGNFYNALIVTENTNDTIMYWAQFWLTKNGQKQLQLNSFSASITYVTIYLYQSLEPGMYDLSLYLPGGEIITKPNTFLINPDPDPASFVSISPDTAISGPEFFTYVTGLNTHFEYNTYNGMSFLKHGDYTIPTIWQLAIDSTYKKCKFQIPFSAPLGMYDVLAGDPLNGELTKLNGFELKANPNMPELVSTSPSQAEQRQQGYLIISSKNTFFDCNRYYFPWHGVTLRKTEEPDKGHEIIYEPYLIEEYNDTAIRVPLNIPYYHPAGIYDVITNDSMHGELVLPSGFTLLAGPYPPSIVACEPDTIYASDSAGYMNMRDTVTVYGRNTHFQDLMYVTGDYLSYGRTNTINDSTFQLELDRPFLYPEGWHDMYFYDETDGYFEFKNAFYMVNPTFGVPELTPGNIRLYPNPATGIVTLEMEGLPDLSAEINVTSTTGQVVKRVRFEPNVSKVSFNLSGNAPGLYVLQVKTANGIFTRKLLLN